MSAGNWNSFLPPVKWLNTTAELRMPILQGRTRRYGKACDRKVSGACGFVWERSCLSIYCCMDHVLEVCQCASPLPAGERLETVWGSDQPHHSFQLDHLLFTDLFPVNYDYFHRELLKRSFAMADEPRVQLLNEDELPEISLYAYSPTRSVWHERKFLKGYSEYLDILNFYWSTGQVKICLMNSWHNWHLGVKNSNLSKIACEL